MLIWHTTRNLSYFGESITIVTDYGANIGEGLPPTFLGTYTASTNNGISYEIESQIFKYDDAGVSNVTNYFYQEAGFTYLSSYSNFSNSTTSGSTSYSETRTERANFLTTATSTQEYTYTTTTTYTVQNTEYTSGTTSVSSQSVSSNGSTYSYSTSTYTLSTTNVTQTVTGNEITSLTTEYEDTNGSLIDTFAPVTSSSPITVTYVTNSTAAITAPIELGVVVSAEYGEWLWAFTATPAIGMADNTPYFITDVAASFTQQTFWPITADSVISHTPIGRGASTVSFSNAPSVTTLTVNGTAISSSYIDSTTTGDEFPRATTSATFNGTTITEASFTVGFTGNTGADYATTTSTVSSLVSTTVSTIGLYLGTDNKQSTSTFSATSIVPVTYTVQTHTPNTYVAEFYGANFDETTAYGTTINETAIVFLGIDYNGLNNSTACFERVPQQGLMQAPDSMAQTNQSATNLSFSPSIYYPFTSSVQENVIVPVPTNTTAMQTNTNKTGEATVTNGTDVSDTYTILTYTDLTSWNYSWSSFTVSYTSATSHTSSSTNTAGTSTNTVTYSVWDTSSSTGYFSLHGGTAGEYWQDGGSVIGGFAPVSRATELGLFIGGALGTSYDTSGGTTAYSTIRTSLETSSQSETVQVEQTVPVFITETNTGGGIPVVSFTR